jgi:serine/threonine-protein kinase
MSAAGQILNGRYRMERQVGSGGFAEVYLATDLGPLGRRVAVKLLHAHLVQQRDFLARFKQEAAMLAQLKHPHILDVYDFGEAGGTIYLVMPYIPGSTLDDLLRTARLLDPARVARYLLQIASALDYAHARRIIHRDLKGDTAIFFVNDTYIATLNVSAIREPGKVSVATGILQGDEVSGKATGFSNFKVTSLP